MIVIVIVIVIVIIIITRQMPLDQQTTLLSSDQFQFV